MLRRGTNVVDALRGVGIFTGLDTRQLKRIASAAKELAFAEGEDVVRQGDADGRFFFILDGRVKVVKDGHTVNRLGPGEHFGEVALIDNEPRSATVVAETPLRTLTLARWHFHGMLLEHPELTYHVLRELCRRWRSVDRSVLD